MSINRTSANFTISFTEWMRILTAPLLSGPRFSNVTVASDRLDIRMGMGGWAFAASVHRSSIVDVRRIDRQVWSWGAHGWRGRWLVNGSSEGLVQVTIDPPEHARCMMFAIKLRQLTLSLDDPDGFITALSGSS